ncbi:hypothetical protein [Mycolicibacterium sp.]|uniref:hypothetical protein n=1 Tax=Mycolicibacterium sp. TaxID=2320850 RepID=UPI00355E53C3
MIKLKTALLLPAAASIAVSVAAVAAANPEDAPAEPAATSDVRHTPATVTVTAMVAPGQCQPIESGPSAVQVTDTAVPAPSQDPNAPEAVPAALQEEQHSTGAGTSRFDPYTCAPAAPATSASESAPESLAADPAAATPIYTAPLAPHPGSSGSGVAGGADATSTPRPLSEPTTETTLPPFPGEETDQPR